MFAEIHQAGCSGVAPEWTSAIETVTIQTTEGY